MSIFFKADGEATDLTFDGNDAPAGLAANQPQPTLSVLSYNVNFGLMMHPGDEDHPSEAALSVVDAIAGTDADVVVLQETNPQWQRLLERVLGDRYRYTFWRHSDRWYAGGVGVLSRIPFEETAWVPAPSGWFHGSIITVRPEAGAAAVDDDDHHHHQQKQQPAWTTDVQIMNLHLRPFMGRTTYLGLPSPSDFQESKTHRLDDLQAFVAHLDPALPTIAAGDFNEAEAGVWGGPATRWLADELGMVDAVADDGKNTWHWPLKWGIELTACFDHVYHNPDQLTCTDARVLHEGASDHYPLVAVFSDA